MSNVNEIEIIGFVVDKPKLSISEKEEKSSAYLTVRNPRLNGKYTGGWYIQIAAFGRQAKLVQKLSLKDGDSVWVKARIVSTKEIDNETGECSYEDEYIAIDIEALSILDLLAGTK
ncbi:MAG: hypothetical protein K0R12_106 [Gammaproteobacteria bacterium]|jgi:single-stranded DNA-binding protein|nr:hypothetical protein [Gammaproteobacteria bacterium]